MTQSLPRGLTDTFLWSEELGYGWHTRPPMSYDGDYFAKYQELDATPMGEALTKARVDLVRNHCDVDKLVTVDIGIGGGRFVKDCDVAGFDVSKQAEAWLRDQMRYCNPYNFPVAVVTCWDSLEHIPQPEHLLAQVSDWAFVSMPIYESMADVLASKHYKPGEHLHYWTLPGFLQWADAQGFEAVEVNHVETELGREGITSFALRRYAPCPTI